MTEAQDRDWSILVVDDDGDIRRLLRLLLEQEGFVVAEAADGESAWRLLETEPHPSHRTVITDWEMPGMGGVELCRRLRERGSEAYLYLIMLTGREARADLVSALDAGADDYLTKPFDRGELLARVRAGMRMVSLEKALRETNQALALEQAKADTLLRSLFPEAVVAQLKETGRVAADQYPACSVLVAEIHNFAEVTRSLSAIESVELLNRVFSEFDELAQALQLEKIRSAGPAYMLAAGVPRPRLDHLRAMAQMALKMQQAVGQFTDFHGDPLQLCIGIDEGEVIAGVVGRQRVAYDLWGAPVTTAQSLTHFGLPGAIQVSAAVRQALSDDYLFEARGDYYVPGTGVVSTYLLVSEKGAQG